MENSHEVPGIATRLLTINSTPLACGKHKSRGVDMRPCFRRRLLVSGSAM